MGTTCFHAYDSPKTYADEKKEVEAVYANGGKNTILQTSKVGNIWYLAVKVNDTGEVWAGVRKTHRYNGEWCYKDMDETMIPYYFEAPWSLLRKLSPTDNVNANEWRKQCRDAIDAKKASKTKIDTGSTRLNNGTLVNVEGMFGKYHGKDLKTMQCHDREQRKFWSPDAGVMFTLKKSQVNLILQRLAEKEAS